MIQKPPRPKPKKSPPQSPSAAHQYLATRHCIVVTYQSPSPAFLLSAFTFFPFLVHSSSFSPPFYTPLPPAENNNRYFSNIYTYLREAMLTQQFLPYPKSCSVILYFILFSWSVGTGCFIIHMKYPTVRKTKTVKK